MLEHVVFRATGRKYRLAPADLLYLLQKGFAPALRGLFWSAMRLRPPRGLLLGAHVQIIDARHLLTGQGVSIGSFSYLDCSAVNGVRFGDGVTLREFAWLQCRSGLNERAESVEIGRGTYIGPGAVLGAGGAIKIGENTQIGARIAMAAEAHAAGSDGSFVSGNVRRRGITVGDRCWIGNNVSILDGVTIGNDSIVGAGSVVTRNVPSGETVFGVPAACRAQKPKSVRLDGRLL